MAKLTLHKETKATGDVFYHIKKDGIYVANSTSMVYQEAKDMYDFLLTNARTEPIIETLETNEIDEN